QPALPPATLSREARAESPTEPVLCQRHRGGRFPADKLRWRTPRAGSILDKTRRPRLRGLEEAHMRKLLPLVILAALMAGACQGATTSQTSKTITILSPDAVAALDNEAPGMLVLESMQAIVNLGEQLVDFKRSGNQSADGV